MKRSKRPSREALVALGALERWLCSFGDDEYEELCRLHKALKRRLLRDRQLSLFEEVD